jgi:recombination protein RecA
MGCSHNGGGLHRKGSWYYYNDEALGNGKETAKHWLTAHPETLDEIRAKVLRQKGE